MKKILSVLMLAVVVLACNKTEVVEKPEVFDVLAEVSDLSASAGTVEVKISTDYTDFEVIMATSEPWVTYVQTKALPVVEKVLTFSYTANPAMTVRKEAAKIVAGGETLGEVIFIQEPGLPCVFEIPEIAQLPSAAGVLDIPVNVDYPEFEVNVESEWLTYVETKGITDAVSRTLSFAYTANRTKEVRDAQVNISSDGNEIASFSVSQDAYDGIVLERIYARYSDGETPWCGFIPGIANRSMASDGKYVYLNSSEASAKLYAVEIASLLTGDQTPVYKALPVGGISGGTHAVSAVECIPNETGDPVLIASNLAIDGSQNLNIYAYANGIEADPVLFHAFRWDGLANTSDWRRYGDRFSVSGTWQNGSLCFASQSGTKVMAFHIENGATDADHREYCWLDTFGGGLAEATLYPGSDEAMVTTVSLAQFWTRNQAGETHSGGNWPKWDAGNTYPEHIGAFSFQFFTFGGRNYIAYVQLPDNTHCDLVVVDDLGSLEASLQAEPLYRIPLYEGDEASCKAANTYGDCSVVEIDGKLHIVAMMQGGGLSIFELK